MKSLRRLMVLVLLTTVALWAGFRLYRLTEPLLTPEQTVAAFFHAWAEGDRQTAEGLLLDPNRLWDRFDVKSVELLAIGPASDVLQREARRKQKELHLYQVVVVRATFYVQFRQEESMRNGTHGWSFFLVRRWPWSPWRILDKTSAP